MKTFCFFLFLIIFQNVSFSQNTRYNRNDSIKIVYADYLRYDLGNTEKSDLTTKIPFNKITFFDVRYDTSFIAINWQANTNLMIGTNIQNRKFNLTNGLAAALTDYFNYFFTDNFSGNAEMICYIKKFSVTLKDTLLENRNPHINQINFEVECYYKPGDLLFPAIRIDTSYAETILQIKKTSTELTKEIFHPLIEKLSAIDTLKILKRNSYTFHQITDRYQGRFNLPILTATQYNKGVYKTFKEFINNAPSVSTYTIKSKGYTTLLYDSAGLIISKAFGFCDGANCWFFGGAFCSPLIRVGNSFEFFYTVYFAGDFITTTKKYLLALNMENGGIN